MSSIYLSPSVQELNPYITGGNEQYYMNRIADAMIPRLQAGGVRIARNSPGDTLEEIVAQSNEADCDLHLALHSNAAPPTLPGALRGPDVYYYAYSDEGARAAKFFSDRLKAIYPQPDLVAVIPNTTLTELRRAEAPAILIELGYHDNREDSQWISDSTDDIALAMAQAVFGYLGIPLAGPDPSAL